MSRERRPKTPIPVLTEAEIKHTLWKPIHRNDVIKDSIDNLAAIQQSLSETIFSIKIGEVPTPQELARYLEHIRLKISTYIIPDLLEETIEERRGAKNEIR